MFSIPLLLIIYIITFIIKDYNKPVISEVDKILNEITLKKPIKYISNGIELKSNFTTHYLSILDITEENRVDRSMILIQVQKQTSFYLEDVLIGYKARVSTNDIRMSEDYILNHYDYMMNLN